MTARRFNPKEMWEDKNTGILAVKNINGGYSIYIPAETVSVGPSGGTQQMLIDNPSIANAAVDLKMKIMEVKSRAEVQDSE